jgi:hypothetical protein
MSAITTIYIPRMSSAHDNYCVAEEFERQHIGKVSHVEFVPIEKMHGIKTDPFIKGALVHFDHFYDNDITNKIIKKLRNGDTYTIDVVITTSPYDKFIEDHTYEAWVLYSPVQSSLMNRHQIVENCRFLEEKNEKQAKTIEKLEEKIKRIQQVVYQMLPRCFDEDGQLYCSRILYGQDEEEEEEDDDESMSTHSSMPELVDTYSDSESDSDTETVSETESVGNWSGSNKSVEHRIRNSNELCGNE